MKTLPTPVSNEHLRVAVNTLVESHNAMFKDLGLLQHSLQELCDAFDALNKMLDEGNKRGFLS